MLNKQFSVSAEVADTGLNVLTLTRGELSTPPTETPGSHPLAPHMSTMHFNGVLFGTKGLVSCNPAGNHRSLQACGRMSIAGPLVAVDYFLLGCLHCRIAAVKLVVASKLWLCQEFKNADATGN